MDISNVILPESEPKQPYLSTTQVFPFHNGFKAMFIMILLLTSIIRYILLLVSDNTIYLFLIRLFMKYI